MHRSMKRAFSLVEVMVIVGLASLLGTMTLPRIGPAMELATYRSAMQQVVMELRTLRFRAVNERRTFAMRINSASRMVQFVAIELEPTPRTWVERTVWLPEGIDLIETPEHLMMFPSGEMAPTSILARVPALDRIFRLTVSSSGIVRLHEEPLT